MMPTNLLKKVPLENSPRNLLRGNQPSMSRIPLELPEEGLTKIPPTVEYKQKTNPQLLRRHSRAPRSKDQEFEVMKALQKKYGDSTTTELVKAGRDKQHPQNLVRRYNKQELLKRHAKATLGYEIEPTKNPLVHLSKDGTDLWTGIKQVTGNLTEAEYNQWARDDLAYQAAGQPLWSQFLGGVFAGLPFMGVNTPMKAALGQVVKKGLSKKAGEQILRDAAFTGASSSPKLIPGLIGATEGGTYGVLQPVDPKLSSVEQLGARTSRGLLGAAFGTGGELVGRKIGKSVQQRVTKSLKNDVQGSLPKPVEIPTPLLYGDVPGHRTLERVAKGEGPGIVSGTTTMGRESSANQLYKYKKSLFDNFTIMNRQMSGMTGTKVGTAIRPILNRYKQMTTDSWKKVTAAYDEVKNLQGSLTGDYLGYTSFLSSLKKEMVDELGFPLQKSSLTAFNQLKKVTPLVTENMDTFNGKALIARYKAINNIYTNAKPADRAAIDHMRRKLLGYMENGYFIGDKSVLDAFGVATAKASSHYKTYRGNKIVDKFLNDEYTPTDVSTRIFSGKALDASEKPRSDAVDKILSILPKSNKHLRNEVFAHLTDEIGPRQAETAIPNIKKHILSGSESGIYGKLFTKEQLTQFEDILKAVEIGEYTPDIGRSTTRAGVLLQDFPSKSPAGLIPKLKDLSVIRRSEQGLITQPGEMGFGASVPFALEGARSHKEKDAYQRLMDSLGVVPNAGVNF